MKRQSCIEDIGNAIESDVTAAIMRIALAMDSHPTQFWSMIREFRKKTPSCEEGVINLPQPCYGLILSLYTSYGLPGVGHPRMSCRPDSLRQRLYSLSNRSGDRLCCKVFVPIFFGHAQQQLLPVPNLSLAGANQIPRPPNGRRCLAH